MKDEALKLAIEAFLMPCNYWNKTQFIKVQEAIAAAEKALAQPEQEPVAWIKRSAKGNIIDLLSEPDDDAEPVYTTPPAAPVLEPVAWMFQHEETGRIMCVDVQQVERGFEKFNPRLKKIAPLYTTPPQRTWVGLTDEEKQKFLGGDAYGATVHDINAIEAKLKEKNT